MRTDPTGRLILISIVVALVLGALWKYWRSELDWAFTDNMKYPLYWNWQGLEAWDHELR